MSLLMCVAAKTFHLRQNCWVCWEFLHRFSPQLLLWKGNVDFTNAVKWAEKSSPLTHSTSFFLHLDIVVWSNRINNVALCSLEMSRIPVAEITRYCLLYHTYRFVLLACSALPRSNVYATNSYWGPRAGCLNKIYDLLKTGQLASYFFIISYL